MTSFSTVPMPLLSATVFSVLVCIVAFSIVVAFFYAVGKRQAARQAEKPPEATPEILQTVEIRNLNLISCTEPKIVCPYLPMAAGGCELFFELRASGEFTKVTVPIKISWFLQDGIEGPHHDESVVLTKDWTPFSVPSPGPVTSGYHSLVVTTVGRFMDGRKVPVRPMPEIISLVTVKDLSIKREDGAPMVTVGKKIFLTVPGSLNAQVKFSFTEPLILPLKTSISVKVGQKNWTRSFDICGKNEYIANLPFNLTSKIFAALPKDSNIHVEVFLVEQQIADSRFDLEIEKHVTDLEGSLRGPITESNLSKHVPDWQKELDRELKRKS